MLRHLPLQAPVVLAHGILGFERIGIGRITLATYFRGIPQEMRSWGVRVAATRVHPTAGILRRARVLAQRIDTLFPGEAVHIIGHSMGGLDARQLLELPGWSDRVLSLTTVGTPHIGTALATEAHRRLGTVYRLLESLGWDHEGFLDLIPERMQRWSERLGPSPGVPTYSLAGDAPIEDTTWPMRIMHPILEAQEGPNDGLVSVHSALSYGEPLPVVPVDHLEQMNWTLGLPRRRIWPRIRRMYRTIVRTIAKHDPAYPELVAV